MRSCGASFSLVSGVAYKPLYTLLTFGNAELKGEHFCGICAGSCHLYSSGGSRVKGGRRGGGCAESGGFARGALFALRAFYVGVGGIVQAAVVAPRYNALGGYRGGKVWAGVAFSSGCAGVTLGALLSGGALLSLRACCASLPLGALRALLARGALRALWALELPLILPAGGGSRIPHIDVIRCRRAYVVHIALLWGGDRRLQRLHRGVCAEDIKPGAGFTLGALLTRGACRAGFALWALWAGRAVYLCTTLDFPLC